MTDHTPSPATDGLRARLTALIPEDCWVLRVPAADASCTAYVGGVIGGGGHGKGARFTEDMCCLPCRLRALLADPAPEAAREVDLLKDNADLARQLTDASARRADAYDEGYDRAMQDAHYVLNRLGYLERRGDDNGNPYRTPTPADLPVATGVTTEDEGCPAGHLEHGACACPAPAPVVSAGDEGGLVELLTRQAREGDEAVAEVARLRRRVRCLEREWEPTQ